MIGDVRIERVDATHVVARAGELGLSFTKGADGIDRVLDLDVGRFIGQADPFKTRRLVERYSRATAERGPVLRPKVLPTVAKTSGGRPGHEFWLTLEEAVFVVIKSETAKAIELTEFIIKVFAAVVRGWQHAPIDTSGLPLDSDEPAEAFERRATHASAALDVALELLSLADDQDRAAVRESLRASAGTIAGVAGREWGQWTASEHIAVLRAIAGIASTVASYAKRIAPQLPRPRRLAADPPSQMTLFEHCTFNLGGVA